MTAFIRWTGQQALPSCTEAVFEQSLTDQIVPGQVHAHADRLCFRGRAGPAAPECRTGRRNGRPPDGCGRCMIWTRLVVRDACPDGQQQGMVLAGQVHGAEDDDVLRVPAPAP